MNETAKRTEPDPTRTALLSQVRADAMKDAMDKYNEITYKIPPS